MSAELYNVIYKGDLFTYFGFTATVLFIYFKSGQAHKHSVKLPLKRTVKDNTTLCEHTSFSILGLVRTMNIQNQTYFLCSIRV